MNQLTGRGYLAFLERIRSSRKITGQRRCPKPESWASIVRLASTLTDNSMLRADLEMIASALEAEGDTEAGG